MAIVSTIATLVGDVTITFFLWRLLRYLTFHFSLSRGTLSRYQREDRTYALITGSSGGIGFGFAQDLVHRGFGVILLAYMESELATANRRLKEQQPDADVRCICLNAMTATNGEIESALQNIFDLPITILINNVGSSPVSPPPFKTIGEYLPEDVDNVINMNARFMAQVTRVMIPILTRTGQSLILNMSSGARVGIPWLSMYSATKASNAAFSLAIAREAKATGLPLDSIAVIPGDVHSDGNCLAIPRGTPMAADFARTTLDRVDAAVDRGMLQMSPYWLHAIQYALLETWLPERIKQAALQDNLGRKKDAYNKAQ